jgi:hypothetical protein
MVNGKPPYQRHTALVGIKGRNPQDTEYVLKVFRKTVPEGRKRYGSITCLSSALGRGMGVSFQKRKCVTTGIGGQQ